MAADGLHRLISGLTDAELYERGRAEWPPAIAGVLRDHLGLAAGARIADVGAGSGKLARVLAAAGFDVVGVEPLEGMREILLRALGPGRALAGTAEALPLPDASVDAAACGDAFHWFDGPTAADELHRVIRSGGGLLIAWRIPEPRRGEPWVAAIEGLLAEHRPEHPGYSADRGMDALDAHGGFTPRERVRIEFEHRTNRAGILDLVASITYVGVLGEQERTAVMAGCEALLPEESGRELRWPLVAELWLSRRLP